MEHYKLTNDDYEIIKSLLGISSAIKQSYDLLLHLELSGKKESPEYAKALESLNESLDIEAGIYEKAFNNPERIQSLMEYFSGQNRINDFQEDLKVLISGTADDLIKRRIVCRLLAQKIEIDRVRLCSMSEEAETELKDNGLKVITAKNYGYNGLANLLMLNSYLKKDFINTIIKLIDKEDAYEDIRYRVAYLFGFCEKTLLGNKFTGNFGLVWTAKMVVDSKEISEEAFNNSKGIYGFELIEMINDCLQNDETNREVWLVILRVALLFCSDEEIGIVKVKYPIIVEMLEIHNSDRELPLQIGLKG